MGNKAKISLRVRFFLFLAVLLAMGCATESKTPVAKAYHNMSSHYNSYFYARESIRQIEARIDESIKNDYDEILPLFPEIDTLLAESYKEQVDEAIKMASLAIQRHPNSKWVDDSYLLVGLARQYDLDFVNAITTYKYINTESEDNDTRHTALIYLLKTFTDYGEYENAVAVSDYLKKEDLNESNEKLLYLYRAYYYQVTGDLDNMLTNLVNAAPILDNKDGKGRLYFIIGQNYQELGFEAEAYNYYRQCLGTNPEYELDFHARLKMAQVTQLGKNSDIRNARKLFSKLLSDQKNVEFKDKIYYEMAEFEMRNNNLDLAMDYYRSSIRASKDNNKQKGLSYLKLGRIYYDSLREFRNAKAYYDSSITALPKAHDFYAATEVRQKVLSDFVTQLDAIQLNDSLLNLARMDTSALRKYLTEYVEVKREQEEKRREEIRKKTSTSRTSTNIFDTPDQSATSSWYFGNLTAVAIGESEFRRIWGDIQLADNWRRSVKESVVTSVAGVTGNGLVPLDPNNPESAGIPVDEEVNGLMASVPYDDASRQEALGKIEEAYYRLGSIYHFDLREEPNAAEAFETLLSRFGESEYRVEVMYLLYLIYRESDLGRSNLYRDRILSDFSNSTYAKLILNPDYTKESSEVVEKLKVLYEQAYGYYEAGDYVKAQRVITTALTEYEEVQISGRFKLLKLLITGETEDITQYQYELGQFIELNPDSDLKPYAETLLQASRDYQDRLLKAKGVRFIEFFEQEHFVIIAYPNTRRLTNTIGPVVEKFNETYFAANDLKTSNLILDSGTNITMVTQFPGAKSSLMYYERFLEDKTVAEGLPINELEVFTITKDNFSIFYQTKELQQYISFFKTHY